MGYLYFEIINKMNFVFEEYIEYIKRFLYINCLKIEDKEKIIEIFYVFIYIKEEVRIFIFE